MIKFENPLQWLPQQTRTKNPKRAGFAKHSTSKAGNYLADELRRLGAKNCIISSNLAQRQRGDGFYAGQRVDDAGVVVYFNLNGEGKAMACDKWDRAEHNLWALYLSVAAIRGLERWGGSELLDGLFSGFKALPSPEMILSMPNKRAWHAVLNVHPDSSHEERKRAYRVLAKKLHPDVGGDSIAWNELSIASKEAGL